MCQYHPSIAVPGWQSSCPLLHPAFRLHILHCPSLSQQHPPSSYTLSSTRDKPSEAKPEASSNIKLLWKHTHFMSTNWKRREGITYVILLWRDKAPRLPGKKEKIEFLRCCITFWSRIPQSQLLPRQNLSEASLTLRNKEHKTSLPNTSTGYMLSGPTRKKARQEHPLLHRAGDFQLQSKGESAHPRCLNGGCGALLQQLPKCIPCSFNLAA